MFNFNPSKLEVAIAFHVAAAMGWCYIEVLILLFKHVHIGVQ